MSKHIGDMAFQLPQLRMNTLARFQSYFVRQYVLSRELPSDVPS